MFSESCDLKRLFPWRLPFVAKLFLTDLDVSEIKLKITVTDFRHLEINFGVTDADIVILSTLQF